MTVSDFESLERYLAATTSLAFKASGSFTPSGQKVVLTPRSAHPSVTFSVELELAWRSVAARVIPGRFAGELVAAMGRSSVDARCAFISLVNTIKERRTDAVVLVNQRSVDTTDLATWPSDWYEFELRLQTRPFDITASGDVEQRMIWSTAEAACALTLCLAAESEEPRVMSSAVGYEEGDVYYRMTKRIERDSRNRTICIAAHGCRCKACGMSFKDEYGELGIGFIHVHHTSPLSAATESRIVNPVSDLVPLCPNCHAMVHRVAPPLSWQELQKLLTAG